MRKPGAGREYGAFAIAGKDVRVDERQQSDPRQHGHRRGGTDDPGASPAVGSPPRRYHVPDQRQRQESHGNGAVSNAQRVDRPPASEPCSLIGLVLGQRARQAGRNPAKLGPLLRRCVADRTPPIGELKAHGVPGRPPRRLEQPASADAGRRRQHARHGGVAAQPAASAGGCDLVAQPPEEGLSRCRTAVIPGPGGGVPNCPGDPSTSDVSAHAQPAAAGPDPGLFRSFHTGLQLSSGHAHPVDGQTLRPGNRHVRKRRAGVDALPKAVGPREVARDEVVGERHTVVLVVALADRGGKRPEDGAGDNHRGRAGQQS